MDSKEIYSANLIDLRYTLFTRIPLIVDISGSLFADRLWAIDLSEHLKYLTDFYICCPVIRLVSIPDDYIKIEGLSYEHVIEVYEDKGWLSVIRNFVPNFFIVIKAARKTTVVHGGAAGWAFPLSYYLYPLKSLFDFKSVFVIESTFWMKPTYGRYTLRQRISNFINIFFVKRLVNQADAPIFTQSSYRDMFLTGNRSNSLINEAVWINADEIMTEPMRAAKASLRQGPVRLIFPSRLVAEKGVGTVLAAITVAESRFQAIRRWNALIIDIVGTGALENTIIEFINKHPQLGISLRLLPTVSYGRPFFDLLGDYDAGIVANLHEEQPRIIYDLSSQGIPCLASRTSGIEHIVKDGVNALLFPAGDSDTLAGLLVAAADMRPMLSNLGAAALGLCEGKSHRAMHERRAAFLSEVLGSNTTPCER